MARKPSGLYNAHRWARRNPLAFALTSILFLVVTVAATVTASLSFRASQLSAESLENFESAKRNMGFLLETIDQVCLSLGQDQRLNRPEFIGLRQQLLQMVIAFNDQFEQLPDVASEMHFLSAKAQTRLGSMTSGDDTLEESAGYLESARTVLLEMHRNAPDRDELSLELARCLRATANVEWRMGIREIAFERNAHATRLCEELRGVQGFEFEAEVELARNRLALGGFLSEAGARDEAENHILQAIEILEKMHEDRSNDRSLALELGHAYRQQGQYYLVNLRHWRKAEVPLERAAELYHIADAEEPGNPDLAANLARTLSLQAKLCYIGDHRQEAVEYLERTCAILVELVNDHGNVADYRALYANSLQRLAEYNILLEPRSPSILSNLEQAVQEYTWLIASDPDHIAYKKGLISTRVDQAELLMLQSEWQRASSCIDSAMMIVDELAYLEPIDRFIQDQKHFLFCKKAELLANVQRFEDSLAAWDQAIHLAPDGFREINRIQRLRTVVLSGDFTGGVAELERLLEAVDDQTKGLQHYWGSAARVFALAHQRVVQSPNSGNLEELAEGYARRAVHMMTDLLAMEMFNLEFTESSPDYNSLRERADFKAIQQEARRKSSLN
jgi:tetratricopeptide (TPR) repeat protein